MSTVSGYTFTVLLAAKLDTAASYQLGAMVAVEANTTSTFVRGPFALQLPPSNEFTFTLWNMAPVSEVSGWALLGEVSTKWVGVSPARVSAIDHHKEGLRVLVKGMAGEKVTMLFAPPVVTDSLSLTCTVTAGGTIVFSARSGLSIPATGSCE